MTLPPLSAVRLAWRARFRYKRGMDQVALSIAPVTDTELAPVDAYLAARTDTCIFQLRWHMGGGYARHRRRTLRR